MFVGKICAYVCGFFINNNQNHTHTHDRNVKPNSAIAELRERNVNRNNRNSIIRIPRTFSQNSFPPAPRIFSSFTHASRRGENRPIRIT